MRSLLPCAVAFTLLLAGCAGARNVSPELPASTDVATDRVQEELVFRGCLEQTGSFPIEQDVAQGFLPEGFTAPPYVGDATGRTAELYAIFFDCPVIVDDVDRSTSTLLLALVVQPPTALQDEGILLSVLPLLTISTDADVVRVLQGWQAGPAEVGTVDILLPWATTNTRQGAATASGASGSVAFETYAAGDREAVPGGAAYLRMFGVEGIPLAGEPGEVVSAVDLWYPDGNVFQGTGRLTVGGPLAQQLGTVPPAALAVHWWGSTYDIHLERNETALGRI